jgi:Ca2+:H+ antiporter
MNIISAIILLVIVTVLAYITSEYLVDSLDGMVAAHPKISKEWITLIVIPIISNAAEHTTAVIVASKGKFDLAMSVAVGSCIQIALFVIPFLVLLGWVMGKPLTMLFDPLETLVCHPVFDRCQSVLIMVSFMQVLFLSVLVVKFSVEDGKSHWMSGIVLICKRYALSVCQSNNAKLSPSFLALSYSCLHSSSSIVLVLPW